MALVTNPRPATLREVYLALGDTPETATQIASGSVTEPRNYVVPRCQINAAAMGAVPSAAAGRLGVQANRSMFRASLMPLVRADPGVNTAVYLTTGTYETNYTMHLDAFAADQDTHNPANYLDRWERGSPNRVYLIMPGELTPLNEAAEREHCLDFVRAYELTLRAVDEAFQSLGRVSMDGYLSMLEARAAMERRVGETLPAALKPIACDPFRLEAKFKELFQQSRDGRDGRGWHSFGVELVDPPPHVEPIYLSGGPRAEAGRVYLRFTRGQTQIGLHPSAEVIHL